VSDVITGTSNSNDTKTKTYLKIPNQCTPISYTLIFLTLYLISIITVILSIYIRRRLELAPSVVEGATR
jgi:hypothetical protein